MHDESTTGNGFFKCDFCAQPWADDRPMVEGHQGSLICSKCLTASYAEIVHMGLGVLQPNEKCVLCLEVREEPLWLSPLRDARACKRCIKQSAGVLERDPEFGWKRPTAPGAA